MIKKSSFRKNLNYLKIEFIFLLLITFLYSCVSSKNTIKTVDFEGTFENLPLDSKNKYSSSMCDNIRPFEIGDKLKFDSISTFNLKIVNQNTVRITCENKSGEKRVSNLKFYMYKNTMEIEKNKKNIGVPFIFHLYRNVQLQLSLDSNRNLDVTFDGEAAGGIFIVYFGENIDFSGKFKRLN